MPRLTVYQEFHRSFPSQCWACRHHRLPSEYSLGLAGKKEAAHIIGGPGRVNDRRSLVMLCNVHHRVQEGERFVVDENPLPLITLANMLWLKRRYDKDFFDIEFIRECRKKKNGRTDLPVPERIGLEPNIPF